MHFRIPFIAIISIANAQITSPTLAPAQTIANVFLGAKRESNYSFVGSVVAADQTATTYEIGCKSGALNLPGFPTTTCDLKDPVCTVHCGLNL